MSSLCSQNCFECDTVQLYYKVIVPYPHVFVLLMFVLISDNYSFFAGSSFDWTVIMLLRILRTACFTALAVVAIPYAVATMTNILCGWPLCAKRYRRAFNPYKVFALNWALLRQLGKVRYVKLMIRWRRFYQTAARHRLLKVSVYVKVIIVSGIICGCIISY